MLLAVQLVDGSGFLQPLGIALRQRGVVVLVREVLAQVGVTQRLDGRGPLGGVKAEDLAQQRDAPGCGQPQSWKL